MTIAGTALLFRGLMFSLAVPLASATTHTDTRPMYTVRIEARNVAYELRVNDIPVLTVEEDASSVISSYPINPWLINGRNTVKVRILPVANSTTDPTDPKHCRVVISGPREGGKPGATLASVEARPDGPKAGRSPSNNEASFNVVLTWPSPAWATSAKIGRDAPTQALILAQYREFHRLLAKKDLDGVMRFSAAKFNEFAESMDDPAFASSKRKAFAEQFATKGKLIDIDEQARNGLRFEYYFGDRLVSIKNDEDDSIIQFFASEDGMRTEHTLFFRYDGTRFVLIR